MQREHHAEDAYPYLDLFITHSATAGGLGCNVNRGKEHTSSVHKFDAKETKQKAKA